MSYRSQPALLVALLGANPFLSEFSAKYKLPHEAVRGGAETMYPEYQLRLAKSSAAVR